MTAASATDTHFDISQLPSLKDGMTAAEEAMKRRKTCRFIEEAGRILKLPRVAVSTAMVFFHRFYAKHSFSDHDRFEVAVASIVLAAKTEEAPKKLNTVLLECHKLKQRAMQAGRMTPAGGSASPTSRSADIDPKGEEFAKLKERILLLERVILHTIGFELSIDHPYKFFVEQIKKLIHTRQVKYKVQPSNGLSSSQIMSKLMNEMVQYAMSFANDSMHTSLCLQFLPQEIATACVYLAGQFAKVEPVNDDWLAVLSHPNVHHLVSICTQILQLVTDKKSSSPDKEALFASIKRKLENMKNNGNNKSGPVSPSKPPPQAPPRPSSSSTAVSKRPTPPPPPPDAKRHRAG